MIFPTLSAVAALFALGAQAPLVMQAVPALLAEAQASPDLQVETTPEPQAADVQDTDTAAEPETSGLSDPSLAQPAPADAEGVIETQAPPVREGPAPLTADEQAAILRQVEAALAAARTVTGRFDQYNADGTLTRGSFALRRPGRMRFEYDAPTPILIVSDGTTVAMQDSELETVDRYPLASTPLGLILDEDLSFDEDVDVLRVLRSDDQILIAVEDAEGEIEGELTMVFDSASLDLLGWITLTTDLQMTRVELSDVETNVRIDPRQFRLDEDQDEEDER